MSNVCIFDVGIATKYGLNEAIIIQNLFFWHTRNVANNNNFFDGHYWSYNSVSAWLTLFPYMSRDKIKNSLKKLEEENIIISGNYNENKYDQTKWYAFSEKGLMLLHNPLVENTQSILQNPPMEERELQNGLVNIAKCLNNSSNPVVNTVVNTLIKETVTKVTIVTEVIDFFNLTTGRNYKGDKEVIKHINQLSKDYSLEDFKNVITFVANDKFYIDNGFVTLSTICKPTKFAEKLERSQNTRNKTTRETLHNCNSQQTFGEEF